MPVPFNDLKRRMAAAGPRLRAAVDAIVTDGPLIGGPPVEAFERAFAAYCGTSHCVGVGNGTDALELALRVVGVGRGDEVVCVANAGGYATTACQAIGAVPVYADVDAQTAGLAPETLDGAVTAATRAVIVTHLYGLMGDVAAVRARLQALGRADIPIVEDCAQAHGAAIDGARAGSLGACAAFSFYPTKNLGALGDGGAVVCQDAGHAEHLRSLRQYGWGAKYEAVNPHGRNSRLDPIHAAALALQLPALDAANETRRGICAAYAAALPAGWRLIRAEGERFVGHLAVMVAPDAAARDRARGHLAGQGIGTDVHYPILDGDQAAWRDLGRASSDLAVSRSLAGRILSLPCFPELTPAEIEQVCDALRSLS